MSLDWNGPDGNLALRARGADPEGSMVVCVFEGDGVESLKDMRWHKVALSLERDAVSLHVDCSSIENKPLELRGQLPINGHTLLGMRATDAASVEVRTSADPTNTCEPFTEEEACRIRMSIR